MLNLVPINSPLRYVSVFFTGHEASKNNLSRNPKQKQMSNAPNTNFQYWDLRIRLLKSNVFLRDILMAEIMFIPQNYILFIQKFYNKLPPRNRHMSRDGRAFAALAYIKVMLFGFVYHRHIKSHI